ncbi:Hydroxyethylthiazole kinase [Clavibacter michiganensis]|uniref:Hydroxyethylthiazole kinase n=1 Tax=Clavibacter michiganensis TaxID=28447 RepID=A0A251Y5M3_9MICO|nr:hydroxyethylthiazole kinase [Clavibacter michiganensis]OUE19323.1 Hydroxyethylthiazole kinase [Clavibacter michiganensis]
MSAARPSTQEITGTGTASADLLHRLRERTPLVQCITNAVVTGFTANVLLALGAAPAMTDVPTEAGPFARIASVLLVNLGTPHAEQREAAVEAAHAAREAGTPWVLDPVAVGALPVRTRLAHELVALSPTIVRGNASEVIALATGGAGGRGVDATDEVEAALDAAALLARTYGTVVAVSGPVDHVTDGTRFVRVHTGDALLTKVTGGGCALGAVMAAFASLDPDPLRAAVAATSVYTIAAEVAAEGARGPGSFAVALLDALDAVTPELVAQRERLS